jgi:hypothetical protein
MRRNFLYSFFSFSFSVPCINTRWEGNFFEQRETSHRTVVRDGGAWVWREVSEAHLPPSARRFFFFFILGLLRGPPLSATRAAGFCGVPVYWCIKRLSSSNFLHLYLSRAYWVLWATRHLAAWWLLFPILFSAKLLMNAIVRLFLLFSPSFIFPPARVCPPQTEL